jgi:two-component sensor histidine kinase
VKDEAVQYVLAMGVDPTIIDDILRGQQLPSEWVLNVADRNGVILARSADSSKYVGTALLPEPAAQQTGTVARAVGVDGVAVLRAAAHSEIANWQIAVNVPLGVAEAPLKKSYLLLGLWTAGALLLTAVLASWFARMMARPIRVAAAAAGGLAHRQPIPPLDSHVLETNELIAALKHAADELSEAEEQRKRAEKTEKLLVGELQHRTKNLLAVIQAIAVRSLRGDGPLDQSRAAFLGRLGALGRSYESLHDSAWKGAKLGDLVRSELELFAGRTTIDGVEVLLAPQAAQNFALALHELATNAAKYGALSKPGGEVAIGWSIRGDGNRLLRFHWREYGGPPVVAPQHDGFGASLLRATLGDARIAYAPEGFTYEVELALDKIGPAEGSILPAAPPMPALAASPDSK